MYNVVDIILIKIKKTHIRHMNLIWNLNSKWFVYKNMIESKGKPFSISEIYNRRSFYSILLTCIIVINTAPEATITIVMYV